MTKLKAVIYVYKQTRGNGDNEKLHETTDLIKYSYKVI